MPATALHFATPITAAQRPALGTALRLMTAYEWMRSAMRSYRYVPKSTEPSTDADRWCLFFAMVGAMGEAIKMIEKLKSEKKLDRSLLAEATQLATWDEITVSRKELPREWKIAERVRDKYWGHWDEEIATLFLGALTGAADDPPVSETSGQAENATTSYKWVRRSWFADLEREFELRDGDAAVALIADMMRRVHRMMELVSALITSVIGNAGLKLKAQAEN